MGDIRPRGSLDLTAETCRNKSVIKEHISHSEIIEGFTAPDRLDDYIGRLSKNHVCYLMKVNGDVAGIAVLLHLEDAFGDKNTYVVDIGFYKKYRGKLALSLAKMALEKFHKNYNCRKLIALIDRKNKAALMNAKWLNFAIISKTNSKYFMRYIKDGTKYGWL